MTATIGAVLIAEIGSLTTRAVLVDEVEGESRMVGHAETTSSVELPYQNALYAILEAVSRIAEMSGRQLIRDGQLIMPQTEDGQGVNHVVAVTSAAGPMSVVLTAIAGDVSAHSATHALRSTYTALLQVVTLDDAVAQPALTAGELSWIERQVQALLNLRPDAVLIAGGLEGGAVDAVNRLAHIVGLTALSTSVDLSGQQRQHVTARPVIYAGNSTARDRVIAALSDRAEISVTDNVRPALDRENLDPVRRELSRLYEKQILPRLPGIAALRRMSRAPVRTVCDVTGLMTRFIAERYGRRLLVVDVGGANSAAYWAEPGNYQLAVLGTYGTAYGAAQVLDACGEAALERWLPFPLDAQEIRHRVLNKTLRPYLLPASRADLYLDHALAREAMTRAIEALFAQGQTHGAAPQYDVDWLLIGGGVLAHAPHPGLALLTALDGLQSFTNHQRVPVLDVHLDTLGLLAPCGGLAALEPDMTVTLFDRDLLGNTPLATCVLPHGEGRIGEVALEVEVTIVGGRTERRTVRHGEIVRIPLPTGRFGQITLRPAPGVRIGQAAPGAEVPSNLADIAGSVLGVVIDARGRPLPLAADAHARRAQLWEWLVALGVESGVNPYQEASPAVAELLASAERSPEPVAREAELIGATEATLAPGAGRRILLDELAREAKPPPPAEPDDDLAQLRQTVEAPKRRGFFRRGKE
jgi:hypothetical protein